MKTLLSRLRPEYLALLVLVVFQIYLISSSDGFYRIDEGTHFIDDVSALKNPSISIGVWQRFGSVWIFALPAQFGHVTVKVFASLLFLLTIFITYKVAEIEQLPHREWIIVLLGFQPVFLDISFTCLTELPAALFLILSYYLYKISWWRLSLCAASFVFLFRYEMSFFAILIFVAALYDRKYYALPFALIGPILWFMFAWIWTGDPTWLPREFVHFGRLPKYLGGTTWDHYLTSSFDIFGKIQVGLVIVLLVYYLIDRKIRFPIVLLTVLWCVAINSLASDKDFNWTGSVGDLRYLAPVAPLVGILALAGLSRLMESLRTVALSTYIPACLSLLIIFGTVSSVHPHHITPFENAIMMLTRRAAADSANVPILSNHWASKFAVLNDKRDIDKIERLTKKTYLANRREYVLWDSQVANSPFSQQGLTLEDVQRDSSVRLVESVTMDFGSVSLFLRDSGSHTARDQK